VLGTQTCIIIPCKDEKESARQLITQRQVCSIPK
jgi:hypothetical protein